MKASFLLHSYRYVL